jgi:hypothetical protein
MGKLCVRKVLDFSLGQGTVFPDEVLLHSASQNNSGIVSLNMPQLRFIIYTPLIITFILVRNYI